MPSNLEKALRTQDKSTQKKKTELAGTMGVVLNGIQTVEVPNRSGFVYVLLNTKEQELIQAFNDKVSGLFGLAVIVVWNINRYEVIRKDDLRYSTYNSNYIPKHGHQHSFDPEGGGGGDVSFIYGKQFFPLSLTPSGTFGAPVAIVAPYVQQQSGWHYIPSTPTPNITQFKPTDNLAKMVLVCMDWNTRATQIIIGTGSFAANLTGSVDVIQYLPATTGVYQIPIAGVRLVSGTTAITWQNIYDVRQYFHPTFTGTSSGGGGGGGSSSGTAINGNFYSNSYDVVNSTDSQDPITLGGTLFNNGGSLSLSGNKVTIGESGVYSLILNVDYFPTSAPIGNGNVLVYLKTTNSTHYYDENLTVLDANANYDVVHFESLQELSAGDQVWAAVDNNSGEQLNFSVLELSLFKLGGITSSQTVLNVSSVGMMAWDEGVPLGTGTVFNFVGENVQASISGSVIRVFVTGSIGGGGGFVPYVGANQDVDLGGQAIFTSGTSRFGTTQIQEHHHLHLGANQGLFPWDTETYPTDSYIGFGDGNGGNLRLLEIYDDSFGITNGQGTGAVFVAGYDANHQHIVGRLGDIETQDFGYYLEVAHSGTVLKRDGFTPQNFYVNLSGTALSNGVPLVKEAPADGQVYGRQKNGWVILQTGTVSGGGGGGGQIGVYGQDEGVPLGTGTVLNVVGGGATLSLSGTVLNLSVPGGGAAGVDQIGVYGQDEGVPLGTGTTMNFVGNGVVASISGTVINVNVPNSGRVLIQELTPSGTGTISFTSIPGTYKKLVIEWEIRSTASANFASAKIEFNADTTTTNYRRIYNESVGTSSIAASGANDNTIIEITAANSSANSFSVGELEIPYYALTTLNKIGIYLNSYRSGNASNALTWRSGSVQWENTAAITQINIVLASGNFVANSTLRLYGEY